MNETKHSNRRQGPVDGEHVHGNHNPYWRRVHRDWRFWIGFFLMCAAITFYFMRDDLSLARGGQPQQSQPDAREK
jgi:hypothetical protein